jgi:low molecular weight protein-tyrosine phosphatase
MNILIVCDGNICRSPLAAEYLRDRAARGRLAHLVVASAGLLGIEGRPAHPLAVAVAREAGLDLTAHRSRGLLPSDVRSADLIVAMSLGQIEALERRYPGEHPPRRLLRAFESGPEPAAGAPNLDDPVLGPIEAFRAAFDVIRPCVDHLVLGLKHAR